MITNTYCENCVCKEYDGKCTNCHEELYILDQYDELNGTDFELSYPTEDSDFMKKVKEHNEDIKCKK